MRVYKRVMSAKSIPRKETRAPVRFYPDTLIPRVLLHVVAGVFDLQQRSQSADFAITIVIFSNPAKPWHPEMTVITTLSRLIIEFERIRKLTTPRSGSP